MNTKRLALVLLSIALTISFVYSENFSGIIPLLPRFQDDNGGFKAAPNAAADIESTSEALYLSALYGLRVKINGDRALEFVEAHRNDDNGFSATQGGSSSLAGTFFAVSSYAYLDRPVPSSEKVAAYVLSLVDSSNNLFANTRSGHGNIKSTYQAIASLQALNALNSLPAAVSQAIQKTVNEALVSNSRYEFSSVPATKGNFYAIYILNALTKSVPNASSLVSFIVGQQAENGGFYADAKKSLIDFESAALSLATLDIIESNSEFDYSSRIDTEALEYHLQTVPFDIVSAAAAHRAISHTPLVSRYFRFAGDLGGRGNKIVQGTVIQPELSVRAFNGPVHPDLDITLHYQIAGEKAQQLKLNWDNQNQKYIATEAIETADKFGTVKFQYVINANIFGNGNIQFKQTEEKLLGFAVSVVASATNQLSGASINQGEAVSVGTLFEFDVKLSNRANSNLKSGDFDVTLSVIDSAGVIIEQITKDARGNDKLFHFEYTLEKADIPAGELIFVASVAKGNTNPHSVEQVNYIFNAPMVATQIVFEGAQSGKFKLGDNFKVSFVPATIADMSTPVALNPLDNVGDDASASRKFFLDISTSSGVVLRSLPAVASNNKYTFSYDINNSYDSLGTSVVSFRYQAGSGDNIPLLNFDSATGELFDDAQALTYTVDAKLNVVVSEKPTTTQFNYGNDATFRFKVTDELTNKPVGVSKRGGVFLALSHFDAAKGRTVVSTRQAAVQDGNDLVINWEVNPNAISGKGTLSLVAEGADGSDIPLLVNGKPFTLDVTIGGDIKEHVNVYTSDNFFSTQTAFVVEFDLTCQNNKLNNVKLRAALFLGDKELASFPVGTAGDKYVASWNDAHLDVPSGTYVLKVYREADQLRAAQSQESKQKQLRDKRREAELTGEAFDEAKFIASQEADEEITPLFTVKVPHTQVTRGGLPFGTQWVVVFLILGGFLYLDRVKRTYAQRK